MRHCGNNKKEKNPDESEEKNVSGSISVSFPTIPRQSFYPLFSLGEGRGWHDKKTETSYDKNRPALVYSDTQDRMNGTAGLLKRGFHFLGRKNY